MADDDHDSGSGLECGDGAHRARDHRLAAELVQHLGALRAHPGPLPAARIIAASG